MFAAYASFSSALMMRIISIAGIRFKIIKCDDLPTSQLCFSHFITNFEILLAILAPIIRHRSPSANYAGESTGGRHGALSPRSMSSPALLFAPPPMAMMPIAASPRRAHFSHISLYLIIGPDIALTPYFHIAISQYARLTLLPLPPRLKRRHFS